MEAILTPDTETYTALKTLRDGIPRLADMLAVSDRSGLSDWAGLVDGKLLPRVSPDFPVMVAICGGGSSGKSTLFNALAGEPLSPTGGNAGMNRRALVAGHPDILSRRDVVPILFEAFRDAPEPLGSGDDLLSPGPPLTTAAEGLARNLVLVDTPDFDTGAGGRYTNRDVTRQALEAADILLYVFTNSNYHNRDNTDFISRMLTGIGRRRCILIYRVYPSFSDAEVLRHARLVGENIYGDAVDDHVLGVFRADEDNAVAAGEQPPALRAVSGSLPSLSRLLSEIDPRREREDLLASMLTDALETAGRLLDDCRRSRDALQLYRDALLTAQSHCVHDTLRHFPMDLVLQRFADIWLAGDPAHIKAMRKTGAVIEWPIKALRRGVALVRHGSAGSRRASAPDDAIRQKLEADLLEAVNRLYTLAISPEITVTSTATDPVGERMHSGVARLRRQWQLTGNRLPRIDATDDQGRCTVTVAAHPSVADQQERLRAGEWQTVMTSVLDRKETLLSATPDIDRELEALADQLRRQMTLWGQLRQTVSAFLNVLPATAAVTYVLHTGDPAGAAGIKIKLTGLFGLHDLYALVAIPATSGLKRADRRQLDDLLAPVARLWLERKLAAVQALFEDAVTRELIDGAARTLSDSSALLSELDRAIGIAGGQR